MDPMQLLDEIAQWAHQVERSASAEVRREALYEIYKVARRCRDAVALRPHALKRALQDSETRDLAFDILRSLGSQALPLRSELLSFARIDDLDLQFEAATTLVDIGAAEDAIPVLAAIAKKTKGDFRDVLWRLGDLGPTAQDAAPIIADCLLESPDDDVCSEAADALREILLDEAIPVFGNALKSERPIVRTVAAESLGEHGTRVPELVQPLLLQLTKDQCTSARAAAALALGSISDQNEVTVDALTRAMGERDAVLKLKAAAALGKLGRTNDKSKSIFRECFQSRKLQTQSDALFLLSQFISSEQDDLIDDILDVLKRSNTDEERSKLSLCATRCLGRIGEPALLRLIAVLEEDHVYLHGSAAGAIELMGAKARMAIPALKQVIARRQVYWPSLSISVHVAPGFALSALSKIVDKRDQECAPIFLDALHWDIDDSRRAAVEGLVRVRAVSNETIQALKNATKDEADEVRTAAAKALKGLQQ